MAMKWAWAFSTDQSAAKLVALGWTSTTPHVATTMDTSVKHTYTGDAVSKRASAKMGSSSYLTTPFNTAHTDGWVAVPINVATGFYAPMTLLKVEATGSNSIYVLPVTTGASPTTLALYVNNVFQANSTATIALNVWHYVAIKYSASTSTWTASLWLDGAEIVTTGTETGVSVPFGSAAVTRILIMAPSYGVGVPAYYGGIVSYDNVSDAGETVLFCSTIEPTSDDSTVGTWTPSTGTDDYAVATPWDTATYTEDTAGASGDLVRMGCPSISSHLGISPTVHAIVSQAVVEGGADFQALFNDGTSDSVGATVTSGGSAPTYGYSTVTSGLTASTTVKVGVKVP